ncbi:hypothetical protein [Thalassospira lohafexi]|uniref:Uncharacterized protein n=1 Tax=Thalassospira lohafexi TaxID=744227 RepID=A0A2N3L0M5_9PROT|nr:hypothetical protein [Thalassospira lohafexi]PKR56372.1 hypothetical protein COO92_21445 [Thalassospira lohafexi]
MTHYRRPGSLESILFSQICKRPPLRLEEFTGVTVDLFSKNSNPTTTNHLCALHIPNLDAALVADGRDPVFVPFLQKQFERCLEDHGLSKPAHVGGDLIDDILSLIKAAGDLADQGRFAVCPNGDGGRKVTTRERDGLLAEISEMRAKLDALERSVECACDQTVIHINKTA